MEDTVEDVGDGVEGAELDFSDSSSIFSPGSEDGALAGSSPSFSLFFCFILRFWNQIFT